MEAIIESVDEFYSENLAQEVLRGMREAASRLLGHQPGALRLPQADGPGRGQEAPHPGAGPGDLPVVQRIFDLAEAGRALLYYKPSSGLWTFRLGSRKHPIVRIQNGGRIFSVDRTVFELWLGGM